MCDAVNCRVSRPCFALNFFELESMTHEVVQVQGSNLNCVYERKAPYSHIVKSHLLRIAPNIELRDTELIVSSGEYSYLTYMQECTVTLKCRDSVLPDVKLLVKESEIGHGVGLLIGGDILAKLSEKTPVENK